tara:strand:- start:56 stop:544 length:489 start_codon:yes stop_codon:yes gene_type:complete
MIISCPNCNKKFKIDQNIIPIGGRLLQCSNCKHKWYFKIETKEEIDNGSLDPEKVILENKREDIRINSTENDSLIEKNSKKQPKKKEKVVKKTKKINQNTNDRPIGLLNMIIVLIISFVAIVIVLDTFRIELSKYIPFLNLMLNSIYAVIADINLFIKDLLR